MTETEPAASNGELPYEKDAPNAYRWTEAAYELLGAGLEAAVTTVHDIQTARVEGECPRCHHQMLFEQVLDIVAGEDLATLGDASRSAVADTFVEVTASCRCPEKHLGRPEGVAYGCGINFRIDVMPESAE
jgi:hypothetical protein